MRARSKIQLELSFDPTPPRPVSNYLFEPGHYSIAAESPMPWEIRRPNANEPLFSEIAEMLADIRGHLNRKWAAPVSRKRALENVRYVLEERKQAIAGIRAAVDRLKEVLGSGPTSPG